MLMTSQQNESNLRPLISQMIKPVPITALQRPRSFYPLRCRVREIQFDTENPTNWRIPFLVHGSKDVVHEGIAGGEIVCK